MYVVSAFEKGVKEEKRRFHYQEAPVALQTLLLANINRDPKKQRSPYSLEEFFFYQDVDDRNRPAGSFGAAAMKLIELKEFPSWALFAFKDLKDGASGPPPIDLAYIGDDCLILAPEVKGDTINGMIIGMEAASGSTAYMKSTIGGEVLVKIPEFSGKYFCQENVSVEILLSV